MTELWLSKVVELHVDKVADISELFTTPSTLDFITLSPAAFQDVYLPLVASEGRTVNFN